MDNLNCFLLKPSLYLVTKKGEGVCSGQWGSNDPIGGIPYKYLLVKTYLHKSTKKVEKVYVGPWVSYGLIWKIPENILAAKSYLNVAMKEGGEGI